jgi:hypothetical protein
MVGRSIANSPGRERGKSIPLARARAWSISLQL